MPAACLGGELSRLQPCSDAEVGGGAETVVVVLKIYLEMDRSARDGERPASGCTGAETDRRGGRIGLLAQRHLPFACSPALCPAVLSSPLSRGETNFLLLLQREPWLSWLSPGELGRSRALKAKSHTAVSWPPFWGCVHSRMCFPSLLTHLGVVCGLKGHPWLWHMNPLKFYFFNSGNVSYIKHYTYQIHVS